STWFGEVTIASATSALVSETRAIGDPVSTTAERPTMSDTLSASAAKTIELWAIAMRRMKASRRMIWVSSRATSRARLCPRVVSNGRRLGPRAGFWPRRRRARRARPALGALSDDDRRGAEQRAGTDAAG